jgi:hypothetical protein
MVFYMGKIGICTNDIIWIFSSSLPCSIKKDIINFNNVILYISSYVSILPILLIHTIYITT